MYRRATRVLRATALSVILGMRSWHDQVLHLLHRPGRVQKFATKNGDRGIEAVSKTRLDIAWPLNEFRLTGVRTGVADGGQKTERRAN